MHFPKESTAIEEHVFFFSMTQILFDLKLTMISTAYSNNGLSVVVIKKADKPLLL